MDDQSQFRTSFNNYRKYRTLESLQSLASCCADVLQQSQRNNRLPNDQARLKNRLKTLDIVLTVDMTTSEIILLLHTSGSGDIQAALSPQNTTDSPPFTNLSAFLNHLKQHKYIRDAGLTSVCLRWAPLIMEMIQLHLDRTKNGNLTSGSAQLRVKCLESLLLIHTNHKRSVFPPSIHIAVASLEKLGEKHVFIGGFSTIWKGRRDQTSEVSLKVLHPGKIARDQLRNEILIWRQLDHRNILQFLGITTELFTPKLCIVSPWMSKGTITLYTRSEKPSLKTKVKLILGITKGVLYLHEHNPPIIHGDIKGANILVSDEGESCIADFGLCSMQDSQIEGPVRGSLPWMAPELFKPPSELGGLCRLLSNDIYSLGCTIYEILVGHAPFLDLIQEVKAKTEAEAAKGLNHGTTDDGLVVGNGWMGAVPQSKTAKDIDKVVAESVERAIAKADGNDLKQDVINKAVSEAVPKAVMTAVLSGDRPKWPSSSVGEDWLSSLVRNCWAENPQGRPQAQEVLRQIEKCTESLESGSLTSIQYYMRNVAATSPDPVIDTGRRPVVQGNGTSPNSPQKSRPGPNENVVGPSITPVRENDVSHSHQYPPVSNGNNSASARAKSRKPPSVFFKSIRKLVPCLPSNTRNQTEELP